MSETDHGDEAAASSRARSRRMTNITAAGLAILTLVVLGWWLANRLSYVHVIDARIAATMINVSSRVDGWIETLDVEEGDRIERGDLLLTIDAREARLQLDEHEATLAALQASRGTLDERRELIDRQTESRLESARAARTAAEAGLRSAESEYERAEADWDRATPMLEREIISRQNWEGLRASYQAARSRLDSARAELQRARAALLEAEANRAEVAVLDAELATLDHRISEARARRGRQQVLLDDHRIRAPSGGIVDEIFIDPGEHASRGQRLLLMHDASEVWISANVKETELRHFDTGSRARLKIDAYPRQRLQGTVARVGTAATSEFALLPTPNPSGNFTKITQRLKIRIDIDDTQDLPLRPGMMVEVAIER